MTFKHILEGYRVLDFTQYLAGPTTTRIMAEMGAEVIKIELPPGGDGTRLMPFMRNGRSGYYIQQNRGKKSVCLDPRKPEGREILHHLVKTCDVLVENFSPGAIGRLGLSWEVVHELNPKLVMCSISTFGQSGPLSKKPGYDMIGGSYAGILDMTGEPDGSPYFAGLGIGDASTGVHGLAGILAALLHRDKIGEGQYIDCSLLDSYFAYHETAVEVASASEGAIKPTRSGRGMWYVAPFGLFPAKDGWVFIAAVRQQWNSLCTAMGREDLPNDPRFLTNDDRVKNREELTPIVDAWTSQFTVQEALKVLGDNHIPSAPILSVWEAMHHPHLIERGTIRTIDDPVFGSFQVPGMPIRFSKYTEDLPLTAEYLGQSNEDVLTEHLGYGPEKIRQLYDSGVLVSSPDLPQAKAAE